MTASRLLGLGSKIIAIGRNYAAHAKELGNAVPETPFFFLKPTSSYVFQGGSIEIPSPLTSVHYEVELGVVIGKEGRDISEANAFDYVSGYAVALDMTARDLQQSAKESGLPWTISKGYDTFTPVGETIPSADVDDPKGLDLWLKVDGVLKQEGNTRDMMNDIPSLISFVSCIMTLQQGDLILTGTPPGVGPVKSGQTLTAGIKGLPQLDISFPVITRPPSTK